MYGVLGTRLFLFLFSDLMLIQEIDKESLLKSKWWENLATLEEALHIQKKRE